MTEVRPLYDPERDRSFTKTRCFLCGVDLDDENRTDEHLFSHWIQHEFDLWDQTLDLFNETTIPYRQVVIPCCNPCNTIHLKRIEDQILQAYRQGIEAFRELDESVVFIWLSFLNIRLH